MADEPLSHRIRIECPECGNYQLEPAMVVSTQCRNCRTGISVIDGKGVVRKTTTARFAKTPPDSVSPPPEPKAAPVIAPPKKRSLGEILQRLLNPPAPPRQLTCFDCRHEFTASGNAQSSQCPKCCGYLSLLDHEIAGPFERSIKTCGNVIIRKNGIFNAASLICRDLTLFGSIHCPVVCSGDLIIRTHAKINFPVRCRSLIVEKGARVEFLGTIRAESSRIRGIARGQLVCDGTVTLEKRSQFHGLVRTTSLVAEPGAHHFGTVEIITAETNSTQTI